MTEIERNFPLGRSAWSFAVLLEYQRRARFRRRWTPLVGWQSLDMGLGGHNTVEV